MRTEVPGFGIGGDDSAAQHRLRRGLAGSLATALTSQLVLVASGVVIARALGVDGRGALAVIMLVPSALGQFGTLGLPLALTYQVAADPTRSHLLTRALGRWIVLQAAVLTAATAAILVLLVDASERSAALVAVPIVAGLVAQQYGLAILQGAHRFGVFNCARVAPATLYAVGLVALVLDDRATVFSVVVVWTLANALVALPLAGVIVAHGRSGGSQGRPYRLGPVLRFGARATVGSHAPADALRVDQTIAALMLPRAALGLYVVALAFTNLPRFISQSLGMVALPVAAAASRLGSTRNLARIHLGVLAATAGAAVVALELAVGRLVPLLFGAEFAGALTAARILLVAALVLAARRVLGDLAQGAGRPGAGAFGEAVYVIVGIPAMLVGAPLFGIAGIAVAVALAAAASLAAVVLSARTTRWLPARALGDSGAGRPEAAAAR